jgi:hypothetical protein
MQSLTNMQSLTKLDDVYDIFIKEYIIPFLLKDIDLLRRKLIDEEIYRRIDFTNLIVSYRTLVHQDIINNKFLLSLNNDLFAQLTRVE